MRHVVATVIAIRFALATRRDLLLEMVALRHQLAVLARPNRRFRPSDRLLWLTLRRMWPRWREVLVLVESATVDRWHRDRFDRRWWRRSRRPGRRRIDSQCRELIGRLAEENRLWGAPRIHGELLKLGIVVSERTVSRYLQGRPRRPSQTWRTFLANHFGQFTINSQVMSPYASGDDVVDAFVKPCRSTSSPDWLSASRQGARIDWSALVRPTCLGLRVTQDHLRDCASMRRRAGRAPPSTCVRACSRLTAGKRHVVVPRALDHEKLDRERPLRVSIAIGANRRPSGRETSSLGLQWARLRGDSQTVGILAKHNTSEP